MTTATYPWNPFNDIPESQGISQTVTTTGGTRVLIVPRVSPFFSDTLVINNITSGSSVPLVEGKDYVFAYPFIEFVEQKKKNAFGGIVLLGTTAAMTLELTLDTIGGPFVLDDVAYAAAVANLVAASRLASWSQVVNLPTDGFLADPHAHPNSQEYNYSNFAVMMQNWISALSNEMNNPTVATELALHMGQTLSQAHGGGIPSDVGLGNVQNFNIAELGDLSGNSNQLYMTVMTTKLLINQLIQAALATYSGTGSSNSSLPADYLSISSAEQLFFQLTNYFSELANNAAGQSSARGNLGLGSAATLSASALFQVSNLFSEVSNNQTQLNSIYSNLKLGNSALATIGTSAGNVMPGTAIYGTAFNTVPYGGVGASGVSSGGWPLPSGTQDILYLPGGLAVIFGQSSLTVDTSTTPIGGQTIYEGVDVVNYVKAFATTPYVFLTNFDYAGGGLEGVWLQAPSPTNVYVRGRNLINNTAIAYNWFAIGKLAS